MPGTPSRSPAAISGFPIGERRRNMWSTTRTDDALAGRLQGSAAMDPARPWSAHEAVLAGLAAVCRLGFRMAQYAAPTHSRLDEALRQLPPNLRELISQTQAAIDTAALAHRQ
jgi:hypothetical protein